MTTSLYGCVYLLLASRDCSEMESSGKTTKSIQFLKMHAFYESFIQRIKKQIYFCICLWSQIILLSTLPSIVQNDFLFLPGDSRGSEAVVQTGGRSWQAVPIGIALQKPNLVKWGCGGYRLYDVLPWIFALTLHCFHPSRCCRHHRSP